MDQGPCVGLLTHPFAVDWVAPQLFRQGHDVVGKFILLLYRYKHLHFQSRYGSASQVIRMIRHIPQTGCIACPRLCAARAIGPLIGKPMFGKVTGSAADRAVFGQCALEEEFFTQLPACLRGQIVFGMRDSRKMSRMLLRRSNPVLRTHSARESKSTKTAARMVRSSSIDQCTTIFRVNTRPSDPVKRNE